MFEKDATDGGCGGLDVVSGLKEFDQLIQGSSVVFLDESHQLGEVVSGEGGGLAAGARLRGQRARRPILPNQTTHCFPAHTEPNRSGLLRTFSALIGRHDPFTKIKGERHNRLRAGRALSVHRNIRVPL